MKQKIAVFGNTPPLRNGQIIAADLTLAGYDVNLVEMPEFKKNIVDLQKLGGIYVDGDPKSLVSGKTGFAKPTMITTDLEKGLAEANIIFLDIPTTEYENRIKKLIPYLGNGQILNFNTYGYWPCLRVAEIIKNANKNVTLTESPAPTYSARGKNGKISYVWMRGSLPLGVFPAKRTKETFDVLSKIYPNFIMAKNVLQTNFENINLMVHPGIAICNIGYFDRKEERGETGDFYKTGNTIHAGILAESQDKERINVCQAYDVVYTSLKTHIKRFYASNGENVYEVIKNSAFYQNVPSFPADIWRRWLSVDVPLAHIPFVSLAEYAGIPTPIHKAIITITEAVLETDFWKTGLTPDKLGLKGLTPKQIIQYVTDGERKK